MSPLHLYSGMLKPSPSAGLPSMITQTGWWRQDLDQLSSLAQSPLRKKEYENESQPIILNPTPSSGTPLLCRSDI